MPSPPSAPRLFLIDGYALIYRAFFALISRPLTTSRGENTSAAWGIVNFLQRLLEKHQPEYVGWVHDSGLSFRHERYPAYKATREKLNEELQADFDRGMERIGEILAAYHINVLTLHGYEADDVIGTLARQAVDHDVNVVIVSGDKDFHQLVRPGIWLLNPGRGGPASVEEHWVDVENAHERLGVPPNRVVDYLALVGDSSDNIPGVRGIGDKTAAELIGQYGSLENILAHVGEITKKRPREALHASEAEARLSKELVSIRDDLPIALALEELVVRDADHTRLKELFVELEFHSLARDHAAVATATEPARPSAHYRLVDSVSALERVVGRIRAVGHMALDVQAIPQAGNPFAVGPLRSTIVALAIGLGPGEAYYLPFRHRARLASAMSAQGTLLVDNLQLIASSATHDQVEMSAAANAELAGPGGSSRSHATSGQEPNAMLPRNLPYLDSPELMLLRAVLEDPAVTKTAHDGKGDILMLRRAGITLQGLDFDTMIASYVLDPSRRSHDLDVLALEFLDRKMTSYEDLCGKGKMAVPFDQCEIEAASNFACAAVDLTLQLRALFQPQLDAYALAELFRTVEMPLLNVLAEMEWAGVSINRVWFTSLKERFQAEREAVEREIYATAGMQFNINSNLQLRQILFERLELPVLKRTATGASTDASVLQELAEQGHHLPELLMEFRELSKLESTYLDALPALVHPDTQRLHTSFNQTVASTGRLSSSDPNLQNIPIRRELGRDIRRGFVPRQGWKLISADYSQIELRLLAHLSADDAFVEAFRAGGDIHRQTAAIIFNVPVEQVTSDMRARAKTINFATIYGQGANSLSRQLRTELAEARQFIAEYFKRFRGVRAYLDSMVEFAREHGYVQTILGRRRYIPELRERNFNIRAFGERTATNSPIQGSAADLIKIAMIRIQRRIRDEQLSVRMLLQVHDELVFESPPDEIPVVTELVRLEMEHAATLSVPLVVDLGIGDNWLETKH